MTDLLPGFGDDLVRVARRRDRRRRMVLPTVTGVAAVALGSAFILAGPHGTESEQSAQSETTATAPVAPQRAQLERLAGAHARVDIRRARLLTPGRSAQLWLAPSLDGRELCLVRTTAKDVGFGCVAEKKARRTGIVSSVPQETYGWAPINRGAIVGRAYTGARVVIAQQANGAFFVSPGVRVFQIGDLPKRFIAMTFGAQRQLRAALLGRYGVLRGANVASDGSRQASIALPAGEGSVHLRATTSGALQVDGPGVASLLAPDLAAGGLSLVPPTRPGDPCFGVLPDGVRTVLLRFGDGSSQAVPVQRNVWSAATKTIPVSVEWTDALGARWTSDGSRLP